MNGQNLINRIFSAVEIGVMKHSYEMPHDYNEDINYQIERTVTKNDYPFFSDHETKQVYIY